MTPSRNLSAALRAVATHTTEGLIDVLRGSLVLLGLLVLCALAALTINADWRAAGETQLRSWLQARELASLALTPEPSAIERATATNPQELPKEQAAIAYWLSKKYQVAPEPMAALVAEAYEQGAQQKMDPTLILAVVAIESRFNPFAQSGVGAQGLMQVMTRVHADKYAHFGGKLAAFDPVSNMRVGVAILKEYIRRTGSVEGGLRYYVGAANLPSDGGYAAKVLAEYRRIRQVAGRNTPLPAAQPATPPAALTVAEAHTGAAEQL